MPRRPRLDFVLLILAIIATFFILEDMEAAEKIHQYSRDHESMELDEIILTTAVSFLYLTVFTLRRYLELRVIHRRAITDPMVNALNRRGGMELLEMTIHEQRSTQQGSSLILFDIDNFKKINDTFGHNIGDRVLSETSRVCSETLRETDTLIRWGGEEFLVLCTKTNLKESAILAERIRAALEQADFSPVDRVTASFGVADFNVNIPLKESIHQADQQLYRSKSEGKNRVSFA